MADLMKLHAEIQQAEKDGLLLKQASACRQAGQIYLERNLYLDAARLFRTASSIYAQEGEPASQARTLNHLGVCQIMAGHPEDSLLSLHTALECLGSAPDPGLEAAIQGNLGLAHSALEDYRAAFSAHKAVLEAAEKSGDDTLRLNALINLADCRLQEGSYRSAQGFALVARDLAEKLSPHPGIMIIHDLLGMISSRQGDLRSAAEHHQKAYQAALKFGDLQRQGIALANHALALEGLTELDRALEIMETARQIFISLNSDYQHKTARDLERIQKGLGR